MKVGDLEKIKHSKTGNVFEVLKIENARALLRPEGSQDKGGFWEPLENLIKVRNERTK